MLSSRFKMRAIPLDHQSSTIIVENMFNRQEYRKLDTQHHNFRTFFTLENAHKYIIEYPKRQFDIIINKKNDQQHAKTQDDTPDPKADDVIFTNLYRFVLIYIAFKFFSKIVSNPMRNFEMTLHNNKNNINVSFDDIAGLSNAKRDIYEIVEFFQNAQKFEKIGASIPKGILLAGPPGCGKTLLAKAIACETNMPFYSVSASEFIQMFVGIGAMRIRQLFENARKNAPAIIFIDEIDAIGKSRMQAMNGVGNDEREQTINQLLTEMDGFNTINNVIVIAATNRIDILDPALLRPGRFDRHIVIEPPNYNDRIDILELYLKNKPIHTDVDISNIAKITKGYSAAELSNIVNEAAILATRSARDYITHVDMIEANMIKLLGYVKPVSNDENNLGIVAYHEAGHAIMALETEVYNSIQFISIAPRGKTGGVTIFEPKSNDDELMTRKHFEEQIAVALGGRAAEEIVFGYDGITNGASSDIMLVESIARTMIMNYGFNKDLSNVSWTSSNISDETLHKIDMEIQIFVNEIYEKVVEKLMLKRYELDTLANALLDEHTLTGYEVDKLLEKTTSNDDSF